MSQVFTALAVSADGYSTGSNTGHGLGDGSMLLDWHGVPVVLRAGRPLFPHLPEHVRLTLIDAVLGAGVTHLRYQIRK